MEICRICEGPAQYDIFNSELIFEEKKTIKIYIILNNFLYDKLYSPDDYSSFICENCCENLYNSYTFMETVRNSERQLKLEPPNKKIKNSLDVEIEKSPIAEHKLDIEQVLQNTVQFDEIDDNFISEPFIEDQEEILNEQLEDPKIINEDVQKVVKKEVSKNLINYHQESVTFLDYILEHKEENNQKIVSVKISKNVVKIRDIKNFKFNVISHSDPDSIYSCIYCIKAFGSLDLLIKHITQCHLCMICFKTFPNYKELNEHVKSHGDQLDCPFCKKSFHIKALRPHIKRHHCKNLPINYSILVE